MAGNACGSFNRNDAFGGDVFPLQPFRDVALCFSNEGCEGCLPPCPVNCFAKRLDAHVAQ